MTRHVLCQLPNPPGHIFLAFPVLTKQFGRCAVSTVDVLCIGPVATHGGSGLTVVLGQPVGVPWDYCLTTLHTSSLLWPT